MAEPQPGRRLVDRYRLVERVGGGGMGEVWRAVDEVLGRTVAVKLMRPELFAEPGFDQRFLVEARAMAGVSHPGVVAIHDYRSDAGGAFLVMEFVYGESLAQLLARQGRLHPAAALDLVARAADAVQAAHDRAIVHRDIKPANIMVRPDGTVLLADFGIARTPTAAGLTHTGGLLGTPSYLAPEQVLGHPATARSDIYALGVVAYECLAGYRPFQADNPFAVAMMRLHESPRTLVDGVSPDHWAVVARALAVDPADRWPTAADLAAAARAANAGRPVAYGPPRAAGPPAATGQPPVPASGPPTTPAPAIPAWAPLTPTPTRPVDMRPARRVSRWLGLTAGALLVAVVAGVGAWIGTGGLRTPTTGPTTPVAAGSTALTQSAGLTVPSGYVACDRYLCPSRSACWGGMVVISGVAQKPRVIDCGSPHYWQTFQAAYLPASASDVAQEDLMARPDIASICSAANLAKRSRDPAHTKGWQRDALPYRIGSVVLLLCLTGPGTGEWTGSLS